MGRGSRCEAAVLVEPARSPMTCSQACGRVSGSVDCRCRLSMISSRCVASPNIDISPSWTATMRYDMIRDAMLTCARKPTRVSLTYRTEPTTKKWKTVKLKSEQRICSEVSVNSPGNPWSQSRRRKGRLRWEGFTEKECFKPGMKE